MGTLLQYEWEIFLTIELTSIISLLLFILLRYLITNKKISYLFLAIFILTVVLEACFAFILYQITKEVTTIQIIIILFLLYAITFGINDFKRMDRYLKVKIGKWKNIDLLTEKDYKAIEDLKNPRIIAQKARRSFYLHSFTFFIAVTAFWFYHGNHTYTAFYFLTNLEWFSDHTIDPQPFNNLQLVKIVEIWLIIYIIDSILNIYDALFPKLDKK